MAGFQESDHPRGHGGKFTDGGGEGAAAGAAGDLHERAAASLKDRAFLGEHYARLTAAADAVRAKYPQEQHATNAVHDEAQAAIRTEAGRIHAENDAIGGDRRVHDAADEQRSYMRIQGKTPDEAHTSVMEYIADRKQNFAAQDQARAAGVVPEVPTAELKAYEAARGEVDAKLDETHRDVDGAQAHALDALDRYHAIAGEGAHDVPVPHELLESYADAADRLGGHGERAGPASEKYEQIAERENPEVEHPEPHERLNVDEDTGKVHTWERDEDWHNEHTAARYDAWEDHAAEHDLEDHSPEHVQHQAETERLSDEHDARDRAEYEAHAASYSAAQAAHAERVHAAALAAQDHLEALHGKQIAALQSAKDADKKLRQLAERAQDEVADDGSGGERVSAHPMFSAAARHEDDEEAFADPVTQRLYEGAHDAHNEDLNAASIAREDAVSDNRYGEETQSALKDAARSTSEAVRALAKVTGRKPALAGGKTRTKKMAEFQESDHPRGHGGKFTSGGGEHGAPGGGEHHDPVHASLNDPHFMATHAERLRGAENAARGRYGESGFHSEGANIDAGHAVRAEVKRIHADADAQSRGFEHAAAEAAHHQNLRDTDSRSRGFADHAAEQAHHEAEAERATRAEEDKAVAAGHITTAARDIADAHAAGHAERQKLIDGHADKLDHAHREASDALAALHEYSRAGDDDEDSAFEHSHAEIAEGFNETQGALHEHISGDRSDADYSHKVKQVEIPRHPDTAGSDDNMQRFPGYVEHPDKDGTGKDLGDDEYNRRVDAHEASHAAASAQHEREAAPHQAEFKRRAEHAQSALERLHEAQIAAHADLKRAHSEGEKSERDATKQLGKMKDDAHVVQAAFAHHERDSDGEIVDEQAREDHETAHGHSESMLSRARESVEATGSHDLGDAIDALKESTKSTASAIKEIARHTGRAPKLIKPTKPAKKSANRPDPGDHASVWDMPPTRFKLTLTKLDLLSLVDVPAQETAAIRLIKRAGTEEMTATLNARVVKITDGADPLVYCWAFTTHSDGVPYHDLQGDAVSPDFIKAAEAFIAAGGPVDEMHDGQATSRIAFAYPMDPEIAAAMLGPAAGAAVKTSGLMVAIRPTAEQLVKLRDGTYNGVSIAGSGIREIVKAADAKCACGATYGTADTEKCAACGAAHKTARSNPRPARRPAAARKAWTTADIDSLPDSSFLYVESGGKPDADGKTTPRSLRHFPYRDATGKVDLEHLRGAISKIPGSSLPKDVRDKLQVRAEKLLAAQHDASKRVRKQVALTSATAGHQHQVDLDDPANGWSDQLSTSYQTSEGADNGHSHAWTYDAATGAIAIAEDSGHTHSIENAVPADVMRQAALNESGERCGGCGEMCEQGCRFCPSCGCAIDRRDGIPAAAPDGDSDSGPAVVIVTARAPRAFSTPSGGVRTVKQDKEPTAMATEQNDAIRALQAENALLKSMATLTDAQRAHFDRLVSKGVKSDADGFLALSPAQRNTALAEIAKADAEVYTSKGTGRVYKQSDAIEIIEAAKQSDAMAEVMKRLETERSELDFAKRGAATLASFAKGAKGNLQGRIMKALAAEFTDPGEYAEAERAMKGANTALAELTTAKGFNPHRDASDEPSTPQAKLDALAAEYAKKNNVTVSKASVAILETAEGAALYAQLPTGRA